MEVSGEVITERDIEGQVYREGAIKVGFSMTILEEVTMYRVMNQYKPMVRRVKMKIIKIVRVGVYVLSDRLMLKKKLKNTMAYIFL